MNLSVTPTIDDYGMSVIQENDGPPILQVQESGVGEHNTAHLVGSNLLEHVELQNTLKALSLQGALYDESVQTKLDINSTYIFIFDEFEGSFFELLRKRAQINPRILIYGVPAVLELAKMHRELLPSPSGYPLYCLFLRNCSFSVTGMRSKEKMLELRRKILHMGGTFVEKSVKVTYLIAEKVGGERYRDACAIAVSIMKPDWIDYLWTNRRNSNLNWQISENAWKCKACYSLKIAFEDFDDETKAKLTAYANSMDGTVVESNDPLATHIVKPGDRSYHGSSASTKDAAYYPCTPVRHRHEDDAMKTPELSGLCSEESIQSPSKRPRCEPHIFSDKAMTPISLTRPRDKVKRVREEWFWTTLQVQYCTAEEPYLISPPSISLNETPKPQEDFGNASIGTPTGLMSPNNVSTFNETDGCGGTPSFSLSGGGGESLAGRKRKRNKDCLRNEVLSSFILPDLPPRIITDVCQSDTTINLGGDSLDSEENVSDSVFGSILKQISEFLATADIKSMSARQAEFAHLIETERNYVTILVNIVKSFKQPCEDKTQPGGPILDPVEIKTIFDTILPIYSLHRRLLRDLVQLLSPWSEENLIGKVYCDHANAFIRAYEPFVNFFESTTNEIKRCEEKKDGRFMAFLKIAQSRPECGKQSLADLMIRPIQRLPSTALILSTLVKRTKEPNPDAEWMLKAVEAINSANNAINEGKRVTEARIAMFDIYNEIDGCPPEVLSDKRSLILRMDVTSLSEMWGEKNDQLSLIVFNDSILILKRRAVASNKHLSSATSVANFRSPSMSRKSIHPGQTIHSFHRTSKPYKFLEIVYHVAVVRVVDILNARCFGLIVRAPHENRERVFGFTLPDDPNWPKELLLHRLAKLAADAVNRLDYEIKLVTEEYSRLDFCANSSTVLEKASRFASKTRHKVSRALSLSRTPSKLKRTVSQMMSPFHSK